MKHLEAKEVLKNRVEWQKPLDTSFEFLSFETPESGRFIQEKHPSVDIGIIYDTVVDVDIEDEHFQLKLIEIKEKSILQMLHDVFYDQKEIQEYWINDNLSLFDYAIILKNTASVIESILSSVRINSTKKVTDGNLKRWFIDLNGLNDKDNGVYVSGFHSDYNREIKRIRKVLFIKKKTLRTMTAL